ncbi:hypothetical protein PYCC9005_000647 [Savitreella phatthalungensis]
MKCLQASITAIVKDHYITHLIAQADADQHARSQHDSAIKPAAVVPTDDSTSLSSANQGSTPSVSGKRKISLSAPVEPQPRKKRTSATADGQLIGRKGKGLEHTDERVDARQRRRLSIAEERIDEIVNDDQILSPPSPQPSQPIALLTPPSPPRRTYTAAPAKTNRRRLRRRDRHLTVADTDLPTT